MTGPNLSENAEGARSLAVLLKERGNYWRGLSRMHLSREYFNAAVAFQRAAVELDALLEQEQKEAKS